MKTLLIFIVLFLIGWRWRNFTRRPPKIPRQTPPAALDMVACSQCGVHIPVAEALPGTRGTYCSAGHRQASES
jgi:uncharacterized protein